jgi:tetratricopeptide (TPR) repeat protein
MPSVSQKKSFWGNSTPTPTPDMVAEAPRKGPPLPSTMVAFADVQLEAALDERNGLTNRQELLDAARTGYQRALQQDPSNKQAMLGLARYYSRVGEREKSVDVYKRYLTANPQDREVAHEVALAHAQWKDWAGAIAWCEFTLKIDPENLAVRKTMAFCMARAGQWEQGLDVMRQVLPEAQSRYLMARVLEHQGEFAASRTQLQLAMKADPNYVEARDFLAELDYLMNGTLPPTANPNAIQQAGFVEPQPQP